MITRSVSRLVQCILFLLCALPVVCSASSSNEKFAEGVNYLEVPPMVCNYGGGTKIKYIKADISLRVENGHDAKEVKHNMPLVRDALIVLLSNLEEEEVSSGETKEKMRQRALARVNEVLAIELGHAEPEDKHGEEKPKDEKKKSKDKDEKSKDKKADAKSDEHAGSTFSIVSDLLFDNLVVQH